MATILITGGTGLVGKALGQALLEKGYRVIILSRQADRKSSIANLSYASWNVEAQSIEKEAIIKQITSFILPGQEWLINDGQKKGSKRLLIAG